MCLGLCARQVLETQGCNSVKNVSYSKARLTQQPCKELGSFVLLISLGAGSWHIPATFPLRSGGQSWRAKPRCVPETMQSPGHTFPVPRTAGIFTHSCRSPQDLQQRTHVGSFTSSPRQGPGCTSYPRCLFSQAHLSVRPKNCSYKCDSPAYGQ